MVKFSQPHFGTMLSEDELETLLKMFKYLLLGTNVILLVIVALIVTKSSANKFPASLSTVAQFKRALIVTAHPDDESMFFLPLVHSLQQSIEGHTNTWQIHLLCLSRGNFDGLGDVRAKELKACASYIGLSLDHVRIVEDPKLQDGMEENWDVTHVAAIVTKYIEEHGINTVFTFDDYGVSGHPNHIITHYGVKLCIHKLHDTATAADKEKKSVCGWALESTNILRKYVGLLDTAASFWLSRQNRNGQHEMHFVFVFRPQWNYNAMALHQSQFVWYRRLFVAFSRYTFINTFRPILSIGTADIAAERKKLQ